MVGMTTCPECMTHDIDPSIGSPHTDADGQGYAWTVVYEYTCKKCGCEFTERGANQTHCQGRCARARI